jgi:predicted RNase H-like HicB family nuclease
MHHMKIQAIVHNAEEGGFWAEVPALPGCVTQGETMDEIRDNLKEAVELWLEAGQDAGTPGAQDQLLELAV